MAQVLSDLLDESLRRDSKPTREMTKERFLVKHIIKEWSEKAYMSAGFPSRTPWQVTKDALGQDVIFFCGIPFYIIRYTMAKDPSEELVSRLRISPLWQKGIVFGVLDFPLPEENALYILISVPDMTREDFEGYDWNKVREEALIQYCMPGTTDERGREMIRFSTHAIVKMMLDKYLELLAPVSTNQTINLVNRLMQKLGAGVSDARPQSPRRNRGGERLLPPPILTALPWRDMACFSTIITLMSSFAQKCIIPKPQEPWSPVTDPDSVSYESAMIQHVYNYLVFCKIPANYTSKIGSYTMSRDEDKGKIATTLLAYMPPTQFVKTELSRRLYGNIPFEEPVDGLQHYVDPRRQGLIELALRSAEFNATSARIGQSDILGKNGFMTYAPAHLAFAQAHRWTYVCEESDVQSALAKRLTEGYEFSIELHDQYELDHVTLDNAYTLLVNVALCEPAGNKDRLENLEIGNLKVSNMYMRIISPVMRERKYILGTLDDCIGYTIAFLEKGPQYDGSNTMKDMFNALSGLWIDVFDKKKVLSLDVTGPANRTFSSLGEEMFTKIAAVLYQWNIWFCALGRGVDQAFALVDDKELERRFGRDFMGIENAIGRKQRRLLIGRAS